MTRAQLLAFGLTPDGIKHRSRTGRLHQVHRGVYAVGRPELTTEGRLLAAVVACGPAAVLSHLTAAFQWGLIGRGTGAVHVSVPEGRLRRRPGITIHERRHLDLHMTRRRGIRITTPARTLVDCAPLVDADGRDALVGGADRLDLIDPERLRSRLDRDLCGENGAAVLRASLDRHIRTDSRLERRFLLIARRTDLPEPLTQQLVHGHRVDFFWPELRLVVETDGLRYHRTPAQQARDRVRDQTHIAAGLIPLRFTYAQVTDDPAYVETVLRATAARASG